MISQGGILWELCISCFRPFSGSTCRLQLYFRNFVIFYLNIEWSFNYCLVVLRQNWLQPSVLSAALLCAFTLVMSVWQETGEEAWQAMPRLATFYSSLSPPLAARTLILHLWLHASAAPHLLLSNVHLAWLYKSIRGVRRENGARTCGTFRPHESVVQDPVGKQAPVYSKVWLKTEKSYLVT